MQNDISLTPLYSGRVFSTVQMISMYSQSQKKIKIVKKSMETRKRNKEKLKIEIKEPSTRKDLNTWRLLDEDKWKRCEYIGFYINSFLNIFKKEDPLFVEEGLKLPKKKDKFYKYSTIIEKFINKHSLSVLEFRRYTFFALRKCKEYSKDFPETKWFFTIYSKDKTYEKFIEKSKSAKVNML